MPLLAFQYSEIQKGKEPDNIRKYIEKGLLQKINKIKNNNNSCSSSQIKNKQ